MEEGIHKTFPLHFTYQKGSIEAKGQRIWLETNLKPYVVSWNFTSNLHSIQYHVVCCHINEIFLFKSRIKWILQQYIPYLSSFSWHAFGNVCACIWEMWDEGRCWISSHFVPPSVHPTHPSHSLIPSNFLLKVSPTPIVNPGYFILKLYYPRNNLSNNI
jgi:hypothetical protein